MKSTLATMIEWVINDRVGMDLKNWGLKVWQTNHLLREFFRSIPIPVQGRVFAIALFILGSQSIIGFPENSRVLPDFGILWEDIFTQVLLFFFHDLPTSQKGVFFRNAGLLRIAAAFAAGWNVGARDIRSLGWSDVGVSTPATLPFWRSSTFPAWTLCIWLARLPTTWGLSQETPPVTDFWFLFTVDQAIVSTMAWSVP